MTTRHLSSLAKVGGLAALYYGLAKLSPVLTIAQRDIPAVWAPSGLALAAILLLGYRVWPGIWIGATVATATTGVAATLAAAIGAGNTLEAVLGAFLVQWAAGHRRPFQRALEVFKFWALAGALSSAVAAALGVTSLWLGGVVPGSAFAARFLTWWLADAGGVIAVAPVLLTWSQESWTVRPPRHLAEGLGLFALLAIVSQTIFGGWLPAHAAHTLPYLVLLFFAWTAFRFGPRETAAAFAMVVGFAVWGAVRGVSPFHGETPNAALLLLQAFVNIVGVAGLSVAAAVAERRGMDAALREARTDLEGRVQERTADLSKVNLALEQEITEHQRAEEALAERTRQLEAVRAVTGEIARELELTALLQLINRRAGELVGATSGTVWFWDEDKQVLFPAAWHGLGDWRQQISLHLGEGVVGTIAQRREGMIVNDYRTSPHAHPSALEHTEIAAVLGEPLLYHDRLLGVLTVDIHGGGRPFTPQDRETLALFADQVAIAIENARMHESTHRRAEQLATLTALTRTLTTSLDPQGVAREILAAVRVLIPGAASLLLEDGGETGPLRVVASIGLRESEGGPPFVLQSGEGLVGIAVAGRQPVISREVTQDPRCSNQEWARAQGLISGIILPLLYHDRVTGILSSFTREPHTFPAEEIDLLQSFAAQAANALANARLHAAAVRRGEELGALLRATRSVMAGLDLPGILERIIAEAAETTGCANVSVLLVDQEAGVLRVGAYKGTAEPEGFPLPLGTGLPGLVADTGQPVFSADVPNDPRNSFRGQDRALGIVTYLGLPIRVRDEVLGVLSFSTTAPHQYAPEELLYLTSFATHAGIAIENARLHAAAVRRGEELGALLRATRSVMSGLDLQGILDRIIAEAGKIAGTPHVKLLLVDKEAKVLRVGAIRGTAMSLGFALPLGTGLSGIVAQTGAPLFVPDAKNDPRNLFRERDRELGIVTYLGLPITVRDQVVGVLTFNATVPRQHSPEKLVYLGSFADFAAIAIENARLYETVQGHTVDLEERVRERTTELEEALRVKAEFLAKMTHELRTPLNFVLGFADLLKQGAGGTLTPKQARFVDRIYTGGKHLLDLVSDILDLSLAEAGRSGLQLETIPLAPLVQEILDLFGVQVDRKHLEVRTSFEPWLFVVAERRRLVQILSNLVGNAVKFTPEGGRITVTARRETGDGPRSPVPGPPHPTLAGGEWLEIAVADDGIGIPPADLERIFRGFEQLDSSATRRYGGAGIGLALVRTLTELHGGRVWAESEGQGRGARFVVRLPILHAPQHKRILVVEDESALLKLLCLFLGEAGYAVEGVESGAAGLAALKAKPPDLMVLAMGLPDMDAGEVLAQVRREAATHDLPILVLTEQGQDQARQVADLGASEFLTKPVSPRVLTDIVRELLARTSRRSSQGPTE